MDVFKLLGKIILEGTDEANRDLDNLSDHANQSESKLTGAFKKIGAAVVAYFATDKIIEFGKACVDMTAEVSAEQSAFEQIMGDYSDTAQKKVEEIADATGMVDTRLTPYMTSMTAKFKGLGYDIDEATSFAQDGLTLAADAAAFWDMSLDESMSHLNSFVNGSYEGGEAIGLFANDTQMAAYAVEKGLVSESKEWSALDEAIKQATRLEYAQNMMQQSGAVGQAAKESGQYANVMANLSEKWRQFQAAVGEPILAGIVPIAEQLMNSLEKVMPAIQALAENLIPKVADVIDKILPSIAEIIENVLPDLSSTLGEILIIFGDVIAELTPFISDTLSIAAKLLGTLYNNLLPPLARLLESVLDILSPILDVLEPIVSFVVDLASSVLGGLIDVLARLMGYNVVDEYAEQFSKLSEEEQAVADATKKLAEETENLNIQRQKVISGKESEFDYYRKLFGELETIVDEDGKIKKGYEDRATVITTTLRDALGIEIETTDGVIKNYQAIRDEIEKTIELKKGQAILSSMEGDYTEAISKTTDIVKRKSEAEQQAADTEKEIAKNNAELSDLEARMASGLESDYDRILELRGANEGLTEKLRGQKDTVKELNKQYAENQSTIENYTRLEEDVLGGHVENIDRDLAYMKENFVTAANGNSEILLQQTAEFKKTYETLKEQAKIKGSGVTQEMVANYQDMFYKSKAELVKLTGMSSEEIDGLIGVIIGKSPGFAEAGANNGNSYGSSLNSSVSSWKDTIVGTVSGLLQTLDSLSAGVGVSVSTAEIVASAKHYSGADAPTATGGIVTRAQRRLVGEDGAEAIIPLEKNTEWIDRVAERISGGTGNSAVIDKLTELNENIRNLRIYLDGTTLVGEIAPAMDGALGSIARRKRRSMI